MLHLYVHQTFQQNTGENEATRLLKDCAVVSRFVFFKFLPGRVYLLTARSWRETFPLCKVQGFVFFSQLKPFCLNLYFTIVAEIMSSVDRK